MKTLSDSKGLGSCALDDYYILTRQYYYSTSEYSYKSMTHFHLCPMFPVQGTIVHNYHIGLLIERMAKD